jgi:hypothetical protein
VNSEKWYPVCLPDLIQERGSDLQACMHKPKMSNPIKAPKMSNPVKMRFILSPLRAPSKVTRFELVNHLGLVKKMTVMPA